MTTRSSQKLRLLTGRAGSGKTSFCLELFRQKILSSPQSGLSQPSYFILPSSEHTERIYALLLRDKRLDGVLNFHVCTINDFIRMKVTGDARKVLSHADRARIVRGILSTGEWPWLGRARHTKGLAYACADFIREVKRTGAGAGDFGRLSGELASRDAYHATKSSDLTTLLERYDTVCRASGVSDPEDKIRAYARAVSDGPDSMVWDLVVFDGFFSFSDTQRLFIEAVAGRARNAIVTLTLDAREARKSVFAYALDTRDWLLGTGFHETKLESKGHRFRSPGLARLEEVLFDSDAAAIPEAGGLSIYEAPGPRQELEMIAGEIRRLVREESYHYSDFMIVLRDVAAYRDLFESVFVEYELPCRIHERKRLVDHPLGRFLLDWIMLFAAEKAPGAWSRFLHSGYLRLEPFVAREAEQAFAAVEHPGAPEVFEVLSLSPATKEILRPVRDAWEAWNKIGSAIDLRRVVESLAAWGLALGERGASILETREDRIAFETIGEILEGVSFYSAGSGPFGFSEALDHLAARIETALYSPPPPGKNSVQIYNTALATQKEYRAVFVAGLEEGRFPRQAMSDAVLNEAERVFLRGGGFRVDTRATRAGGERFYFYMAATRARDRLYLTRAAADSDGRAIAPSPFLGSAARCFAPGSVGTISGGVQSAPVFARAASRGEFVRLLAGKTDGSDAAESGRAAGVLRAVLEPQAIAGLAASFRALRRENRLRSDEALRDLSEFTGPFSATRLKRLANCAYQHFAYYQLRLRSDESSQSAPIQNGNILHDTLEKAYRSLFERRGPGMPGETELQGCFLEKLDESFKRHPVSGEKPYRTALRLDGLRRKLSDFAHEEATRFRENPRYRPSEFEWKFNMEIDLGGESVAITGKIDRVDVDPDSRRAWILDYKSGMVRSHVDLGRGEDVQAPLYLWAVEKIMNLKPRGIEFVSLASGKAARFAQNLPGEEIGEERKGWLNEELYGEKLERMRGILAAHVRKLRQADIRAESVSCRYCDYQVLCRFEDWRLKNQ